MPIPVLISALVVLGVGLCVGLALIINAILKDGLPDPKCLSCGHGSEIHTGRKWACQYGACRCPRFVGAKR